MKNITLSVEEEVLDKVRIAAAKRRTSVNGLVREYLEQVARSEAQAGSARERLLQLIDESPGRLGPNWKWNREDAYQGRVLPGHEHPVVRGTRKGR
jgi:hypothetical protein